MIRAALFLCILAVPASAQTAPIDPIGERPGRWLSIPREGASSQVLEAPSLRQETTPGQAPTVILVAPEVAPVLAAPEAAPLIATPLIANPELVPLVTTPEAATVLKSPETAPLIEPPRGAPDTRPTPRPPSLEVADGTAAPELDAPEAASEIAAEVAGVVAVPVANRPPANGEAEVEVLAVPALAPLVSPPLQVAPQVHPAPVEAGANGAAYPSSRPQDAASMAEALAARIAAEAQQIVIGGPREISLTSPDSGELLPPLGLHDAGVSLLERVEPTRPSAVIDVDPAAEAIFDDLIEEALQIRAPTPLFAVSVAAPLAQPVRASAVRLPDMARYETSAVAPRGVAAPSVERTPILPNLHPSGPTAMGTLTVPMVAPPTRVSAVLVPGTFHAPVQVPDLTLATAPRPEMFPYSALPPSSLPEGPDVLSRMMTSSVPFSEASVAVSVTGSDMAPARILPFATLVRPLESDPPRNPGAIRALPTPDAGAIARLIADAQICWRMADLSVEARWAEVSVDVALDEWNMLSARSITLTGFARVVSGAAEDAYRAAHSALMGCAMASEHAPATAATTLLFDRNGVHLR